MASLTRWAWIWVDSGSWWWTGSPGVLRFMGLQRVGHDWATELNWTENWFSALCFYFTAEWISCMCTHIPFLLSLPSTRPHPTPLGPHRAPSWALYALPQAPTSYLLYIWYLTHRCQCYSLTCTALKNSNSRGAVRRNGGIRSYATYIPLASQHLCFTLSHSFQHCYCSVTQSFLTLCDRPYDLQHTSHQSFTVSQSCSCSCPLSQWCHPTISSSVFPFSSCPKSFLASFPMSHLFTSDQMGKVLELQSQSLQWICRVDFL